MACKGTTDPGVDALRWLLNISDPLDEPDATIGDLLDNTHDTDGYTMPPSP